MKHIRNIFNSRSKDDGNFFMTISKIVGFKPKKIEHFRIAFTHRSMNLKDDEGNAINYERFEFSGVVGAGIQIDAGFGNITIDGRFQQGITELYDIPLVSERVRNRGFAINAGVSIPLY